MFRPTVSGFRSLGFGLSAFLQLRGSSVHVDMQLGHEMTPPSETILATWSGDCPEVRREDSIQQCSIFATVGGALKHNGRRWW